MKKLFLIFFVLLIAIGLGFLIHQDPGYVMVSYDKWVIATSIWVGAATTLIAFFIFYFFIRFFSNVMNLPKKMRKRKMRLRAKNYRKWMSLGIAELANGNQKKAEKCFSKLKKLDLINDEELTQLIQLHK